MSTARFCPKTKPKMFLGTMCCWQKGWQNHA